MASDQASSGAASRVASRTDPGWKYCFPVQEGDTNTVVCSFCSKEMRGGITRAKQHLMAKKGNVAPCTKCPKEVREELWALLKEKEKGDSSGPPSDRVDVDDILYVESEDEVAVTPSSAARKKNAAKKGPLDLYCNAANAKRRREKMRQKDIQECCDKKAILRVHQKIARWWYQAGLSFNCIKLESFQEMLTEVGAYGPNIVAPTYHAIRVPLLNMEMEYTNELLKNHEEQWSKHGCSIMSDAWTDRKQRCIINFLVSSSAGTKFVKSIDGSNFVKTGEKLFELLDSLVEEIGEEKVVQIITDNGSNYVLAGKMLEEKRKHLYWTPCAAHCLDLMLEDIGKIPSIKKTIQRAISLVGFIYSHSSTLSLLRQFTNKRELVRHAVARFATSFLSLERLYGEKSNLRKMFTSDEWNNNKLSKESKGKEASKVVLMPSFWNHVVFTLKVMAPLVRVLRLVDGERKPAMGYIYEAMDKAKETIMKSFNNIESKYKDIFAIIDERWNCQLHRPLHAAGHFLNPEFFYANTDLEFDLEVTNGLYDCISRLVTSRDVQHKILAELPIYKSASGLFGGDFAISQRKTIAPAQWWRMYGHSAPNLQKLAIKILSLTCSASGCERNWSVFEQLQTTKFLYGCAVGASILKVDWLTDCLASGTILQPEKYMILPNRNDMKWSRIGPEVHRRFQKHIFERVGIMLHGKHSFCTKLASIIKHGGGLVFKTLQWLVRSIDDERTSVGAIVVEDKSTISRHLTYCALERDIPIMPSSWIVKSLYSGKLLPFTEEKNTSPWPFVEVPSSMDTSKEI